MRVGTSPWRGATFLRGRLCRVCLLGRERIADLAPKWSNPALPVTGDAPPTMMRNQNIIFPNSTARLFVGGTARKCAHYAVAILSVAVAIISVELITRLLQAEPIALLMLCAIIFTAWIGGFGPALFAIALALLAFHYYLVPPVNSFAWKQDLLVVGISEVPRLMLFCIIATFVAFMISTQGKTTEALRRSGGQLQEAIEEQRKRVQAALLHTEMHLTEAQRLSRTGSFGWSVPSGEIFSWSDETFRIFECDRLTKPTQAFICPAYPPGRPDCDATDHRSRLRRRQGLRP